MSTDTLIGRSAEVSVNQYGYQIKVEDREHPFKLPRVTSFTGALPKNWLGRWAAKYVAEYAVENFPTLETMLGQSRITEDEERKPDRAGAIDWLKKSPYRYRDERGDRGSAVHAAVHAYIEERELPDMTEDELNCAIAVEAYLRDHDMSAKAVEFTVFSLKYGYAGTPDLWGDAGISRLIVDWKTSKNVYTEHAVQTVSYTMPEYAIIGGKVVEWGPNKADALQVVHVDPDSYPRGYAVHEIMPDVQAKLWDVFRAAKFIKQEWLNQFTSGPGQTPKAAAFSEPFIPGKEDK